MKTIFLALVLLANTTAAKDVANFATFPGARVKGACDGYAKAVETALWAIGVESYYVAYEHPHGIHAIVLYRIAGKWRCVDNEHAYSFSVHGETVLALCRCLSSSATRVVESAVPLPLK